MRRRKPVNVTQLPIGRKWNNAVSNARSYIWLLKVVSSESMEPLKMREINLECFCLTARPQSQIRWSHFSGLKRINLVSRPHSICLMLSSQKDRRPGTGVGAAGFVCEMSSCWCGILGCCFLTELHFLSAFWISRFLCKGNPVPTAKFSLECTERPACDC